MSTGLVSLITRRFASRLIYREYGVPCEVVQMEDFPDPKVEGSNEVVVQVVAVPVHPSHINTIQGTYPIKPKLPAVGGGEGIARVLDVGTAVKSLKPGDLVYPEYGVSGTWSTHLKGTEKDFERVQSPEIDVIAASVLRVNPGTAYRMLTDFANLFPGDFVIQNGANSAVGQAVIQIARAKGLKTVNVVRDRPEIASLKEELQALGADVVVTEAELRALDKEFRNAKLALNCTGGSSSTEISKCLGHGGVHVTYGGMSLKPVVAATSGLIFKDIRFQGFWMTRWMKENQGSEASKTMYQDLEQMSTSGALKPSKHELASLSEYSSVLEQSMKGFKKAKYIFDLRYQ